MKAKFTLCELVLVGAAVLILAALMPQLLAESSGRARGLSCTGNLAAIGKATAGYVSDYGALPRRGIKGERKYGYNPAMSWVTLTVPYLGVKLEKPNIIPQDVLVRELLCPEDVSPAIPDEIFYGQGGCSYITNNMFTAGGRSAGGIAYGVEISRVKRPAEKYYAFDSAGVQDFITAVDPFTHALVGYRHGYAGSGNGSVKTWQEKLSGGVNVLFVDGHAGNNSGRSLTCKEDNDPTLKNWGEK